MSDPLIQRVTQQVAEQAAQQQGTAASQTQPSAADQKRFEQALRPDQVSGVQDVQQAQLAQNVQTAQAGEQVQPPTLGDAILDGLEKMKSSHDLRMENIQDRLVRTEGAELSVQDALALQFEVMQLGIEQDLTTKVADKTSQGVQTLFRNQ